MHVLSEQANRGFLVSLNQTQPRVQRVFSSLIAMFMLATTHFW